MLGDGVYLSEDIFVTDNRTGFGVQIFEILRFSRDWYR
eukprot:COSAG03_NODE_194_length_10851_cov_22.306920_7_plen_38_part_00